MSFISTKQTNTGNTVSKQNLTDAQRFISEAKNELKHNSYNQANLFLEQAKKKLEANGSAQTDIKSVNSSQEKIALISQKFNNSKVLNPQLEEVMKKLDEDNKQIIEKQEKLENAERKNLLLVNDLNARINKIINSANNQKNNTTETTNKIVKDDGYSAWRNTVPFGKDDSREAYEDELAYQEWKNGVEALKIKGTVLDSSREAYEASKKIKQEQEQKQTVGISQMHPQSEADKKKTEEVRKTFQNQSKTINQGAADILNVVVGITSTLAKWGEKISDAWTTTGAIIATPFTKGYDLIAGTHNTEYIWDYQMNQLADSAVDNIKNDFYSKGVGKVLDNSADGAFKSNGEAVSLINGLTNVAANVGISALTGGTVNPTLLQAVQTFGGSTQKAAKELKKQR